MDKSLAKGAARSIVTYYAVIFVVKPFLIGVEAALSLGDGNLREQRN